jgi:lipopolysaccharide exporter
VLNSKLVNLKGDLFATTFCFVAQAIVRFGSSLILTRILRPEAYGIITILMSIVFVVEMLADLGVTLFIIRDKNGDEPRYLNTAWTIRLGRALLNSAILIVFAPMIASSIYSVPALVIPLRVFSLWFIISGLESMAFPLAIRRKRARIIMYSELASLLVSSAFTVTYCIYSRDYWGMVYGTLLNRLLLTLLSHCFYRNLRPMIFFEWAAARDILGFTKFTMPSSMLYLALSQFDKVVFLRLFNLSLLGVYGLASNIAGPVESLISKISQTVLYPRCAHNFRANPQSVPLLYYTENVKLFMSLMFLPAALWGAAQLVITLLYPSRYSQAGVVLQAFMVRAALFSLVSPAEDLLIAAGEFQVMLIGNVLRAIWIFSASLIGNHFFGFVGFIYGIALGGLPPLTYYLWRQRARGLLIVKYEFYKVWFIVGVAFSSYVTSRLILAFLGPTLGIKVQQ